MRILSKGKYVSASLLALAVLSYAFWLTGGHFDFWHKGKGLGLTFNSMLDHMLQGKFDVDPSIIAREGFLRDGRVFSYWGTFFALIRWPLALFSGGLDIDVTYFSCLVAVSIAAWAKLRTLNLIFLSSPSNAGHNILYLTLAISILFGGAQVSFLRPLLYQEVCLWAGALAAIFIYYANRGILHGQFSVLSLCSMAFVAGLALNARVSMGVGLYAATSFLILAILIKPLQGTEKDAGAESDETTLLARIFSCKFLLPLFLLLAFAVLAGIVNYQRWGNPLVFADYQFYLYNEIFPDRLPRTELYGLFNLSRVPFGILYYFIPIWVLRRTDGHLLFEEYQWRLMDATELPPSSFLLTDTLLVLLLLYACWSLIKARPSHGISRLHVLAIGTGLAASAVLMLTAISMNHRYRIEFYPLIEFGAFLGFFLLCRHPLTDTSLRRVCTLAIASSALGILGSHVVMILYKFSYLGPPIHLLRDGVLAFYLNRMKPLFSLIGF